MTSQAVDIFSMLNKAQNEYQQQNSVAAFFQQASNGGAIHHNNNVPVRSMPMQINSLNSLEQIERQIKTSPPYQDSQNFSKNNVNLQTSQSQHTEAGNSPLAQFLNFNNFSNVPRPLAGIDMNAPRETTNGHKISAPPGFSSKVQPQKNLLVNKETKLVTPTMFAPSSNNEKKSSVPEPLTKNQLLQAFNYLLENDEDFMKKVHESYIKSFKSLSS